MYLRHQAYTLYYRDVCILVFPHVFANSMLLRSRCMLKFKRLACGSDDVTQHNTINQYPYTINQYQHNTINQTKVSIAPSFILNWCVCMSAAASRRNWLSCCWLPGSQSITPHFSTVLLKLINNTHNSNVTGHSKVCGSKEVRSWIWIQWNSPQSDKRAYKRFRNHGCKRTFSKLANCLCFLFCKEQLFEFLIR